MILRIYDILRFHNKKSYVNFGIFLNFKPNFKTPEKCISDRNLKVQNLKPHLSASYLVFRSHNCSCCICKHRNATDL